MKLLSWFTGTKRTFTKPRPDTPMPRPMALLDDSVGSVFLNDMSTWPPLVNDVVRDSEMLHTTPRARKLQAEEDRIYVVVEAEDSSNIGPFKYEKGYYLDIHEANLFAAKQFLFGGAYESAFTQNQHNKIVARLVDGYMCLGANTDVQTSELTTVEVQLRIRRRSVPNTDHSEIEEYDDCDQEFDGEHMSPESSKSKQGVKNDDPNAITPVV
ncbi:hypothetical protein P280DRAFT_467006 [Massarina eburnea CBS 473.64]|uniref:Uncharacterized protein n=1 Tax=Massarina eburnea CBS 473.64 TaxID=1395130 RepID=A0A6A6SCC5_9PLEO|nr:hypothetical protein P280DRAFT_467006 [Massarina eburnea CBS 473.64]